MIRCHFSHCRRYLMSGCGEEMQNACLANSRACAALSSIGARGPRNTMSIAIWRGVLLLALVKEEGLNAHAEPSSMRSALGWSSLDVILSALSWSGHDEEEQSQHRRGVRSLGFFGARVIYALFTQTAPTSHRRPCHKNGAAELRLQPTTIPRSRMGPCGQAVYY